MKGDWYDTRWPIARGRGKSGYMSFATIAVVPELATALIPLIRSRENRQSLLLRSKVKSKIILSTIFHGRRYRSPRVKLQLDEGVLGYRRSDD